jgi:hypothetical protein
MNGQAMGNKHENQFILHICYSNNAYIISQQKMGSLFYSIKQNTEQINEKRNKNPL